MPIPKLFLAIYAEGYGPPYRYMYTGASIREADALLDGLQILEGLSTLHVVFNIMVDGEARMLERRAEGALILGLIDDARDWLGTHAQHLHERVANDLHDHS